MDQAIATFALPFTRMLELIADHETSFPWAKHVRLPPGPVPERIRHAPECVARLRGVRPAAGREAELFALSVEVLNGLDTLSKNEDEGMAALGACLERAEAYAPLAIMS